MWQALTDDLPCSRADGHAPICLAKSMEPDSPYGHCSSLPSLGCCQRPVGLSTVEEFCRANKERSSRGDYPDTAEEVDLSDLDEHGRYDPKKSEAKNTDRT